MYHAKRFKTVDHLDKDIFCYSIDASSGCPYAMEIYSGRKNEPLGMPLGEDVVTQLLSKIADPSRHEIYFDTFFTSYNLLKKLADSIIRATGTVQSNRIGQCHLLDNNTLAKEIREAMDYRSDETGFICRWNDNLVVAVASNHQTHEPISNTKRYSKSAKKKIGCYPTCSFKVLRNYRFKFMKVYLIEILIHKKYSEALIRRVKDNHVNISPGMGSEIKQGQRMIGKPEADLKICLKVMVKMTEHELTSTAISKG
ncbi:piggyBac transposable element-derived protein 3 [Nephila pilipes]|uniref:PiggyBac transposable element-derived protein 3 n=1 Tax=Nephila pilipes TaxID=299642 RepID=A0A8X6PTA2_NEPPI|nr:piggyBac transposable element-derived protein 3 [Nephila pilipes]